ncbi:MAG: CDP-glycerol glycerophosphotransferase family protein [Christensenellaceae bacterium]|nr:CDP-glycerol glycerophosphotransferase family protein [Christensenellaceae bacterium]
MKWAPVKEGSVLFLSRQSDQPGLDLKLLADELQRRDGSVRVTFMCRRMGEGGMAMVKTFFVLLGQMRQLARSRVCIVDGYCIPVSILKHKKQLKVLQLWHAMGAVKKFGYQTLDKAGGRSGKMARAMCMHRGYHAVVSGSAAMVPYFAEAFDTPAEKFMPVGMPRIDYLMENREVLRECIFAAHPELKAGGGRVILYAPTFRREKEEKKPAALIEALDLSKDRLIVKTHPLRPLSIDDPRVCPVEDFSALELLVAADIVITDYSAISIEAASVGAQVYLYVYDYEEYAENNGMNIDLFAELPGFVFRGADELAAAIAGDAGDSPIQQAFREKYVGNLGGSATAAIAGRILSWLAE